MHPVLRTVLQRLGLGLLTLFIVSIVIFMSLELLPGGFAEAILGQGATPETVAAPSTRPVPATNLRRDIRLSDIRATPFAVPVG